MKPRPSRARLGDVLLRAGMIDADGLARALDRQKGQPGRLGSQLLQMGLLAEEDLAKALAAQWGVPAFLPSLTPVEPAALALVPQALARRRRALPLAWEPDRGILQVALCDPHDLRAVDEIRFASGARKVLVQVAPEATVERLIARHYEGVEPPAAPMPEISLASLSAGPAPAPRPGVAPEARGRGEAVVADPDPRRRRALAGLLEAQGFRVHRAASPQEAAALADRKGLAGFWLHAAWRDELGALPPSVRLYDDPVADLEGALGPAAALRAEALALAARCGRRLLGEGYEPAQRAVNLVRFLAGRRGLKGPHLDSLLLRAWALAMNEWKAEGDLPALGGDGILAAVTTYERALAEQGVPALALEALRADQSLDADAVTSLMRWVAGEDLLTRSEARRRLLAVLPEACAGLAAHLAGAGWELTRPPPGVPAPVQGEAPWDAVLAPLADGLPLLEAFSRLPPDRRPPVFLLAESAGAPDTMYALRLGAEDVLPFDVHPEVLETKLARAAGRRSPERGFVTGNLRDMSLADTLQILSNGLKTAVIAIEGPKGTGQVALVEGRIVDAQTAGATGEEALYELIRWGEGAFRIVPGQTVDAVTVEGSTEGLLMEGFRRLDEDRRAAEASDEVPDLG